MRIMFVTTPTSIYVRLTSTYFFSFKNKKNKLFTNKKENFSCLTTCFVHFVVCSCVSGEGKARFACDLNNMRHDCLPLLTSPP